MVLHLELLKRNSILFQCYSNRHKKKKTDCGRMDQGRILLKQGRIHDQLVWVGINGKRMGRASHVGEQGQNPLFKPILRQPKSRFTDLPTRRTTELPVPINRPT